MIKVRGLAVQVIRKDIKNLHLGVYPPHGHVRVASPLNLSLEAIRLAIVSRIGWIKKQQAKYLEQERQSKREYITGETHYLFGKRYRLNVIFGQGRQFAMIRNKSVIDLHVNEESNADKRHEVFTEWSRRQLKEHIPPLIEKWEKIIGVKVSEWGVKQMKTKWGSCNQKAKRIWLNLELVKKPIHCIEYIIAHELLHMIERHHNDKFTELMTKHCPKWSLYKEELNRTPLGHADW